MNPPELSVAPQKFGETKDSESVTQGRLAASLTNKNYPDALPRNTENGHIEKGYYQSTQYEWYCCI